MDITPALAPVSDQLDAIELVQPRTFTIDTGSKLGARDGKRVAEIRLVGFDRVWRPSKGMLDVLAACWGTDAKAWVGHHVTLYNDPDVTFGREKVGGVRISHLSHIDGPRTVTIRAAGGAGRKRSWPVQPLSERDILRAEWQTATPQRRAEIEARVKALDTNPPQGPGAPQAEETAPSRAAADDRTPDPAPAEPDSNPLHYSADEIGEQGGLL